MEEVKYVNSFAELHEHIGRNEPCVFQVPQKYRLPCQTKWTKQYLTKAVGDKTVMLRSSSSKKYVDPSQGFGKLVQSMLVSKMTIADFLETGVQRGMAMSGTDTYLFHKRVANPAWSKLWEDAKAVTAGDNLTGGVGFLPEGSLHTVGLWLSGAGIKSILHFDDSGNNNLNFQIGGSKQMVLFPPSDWPQLKTFAAVSLHAMDVYAKLIDSPDQLQQLDQLADTHPVFVHLQENDVLYIPSHWYHYVKHEGDFNVNMTCWFAPQASSTVTGLDEDVSIPKRSCSDWSVIIKMVAAFAVSGLINSCRKIVGGRALVSKNSTNAKSLI